MPELRELTEHHQFEESLNAAVPRTGYNTICKTMQSTAVTIQGLSDSKTSIGNSYFNTGCCQAPQRSATEARRMIGTAREMHSGAPQRPLLLSLQRTVPRCKQDTWFSLSGSRTDSLEAVRCWERQGQSKGHCIQARILSAGDERGFSAEGWETESMQDAGESVWRSCLI